MVVYLCDDTAFTQGKNLSDNRTLIELGKDIGLTENDVNEALSNNLIQL